MNEEDKMVKTDKPYIKVATVKRKLLQQAKATRAHKFTQVSDNTLHGANTEVRIMADRIVSEYTPDKHKPVLVPKDAVKKLLVDLATQKGVKGFKPTSDMIVGIDLKLRDWCDGVVKRLPSAGRTI
jgi:hypothetical protein